MNQRGFSLTEILVATSLLAIVALLVSRTGSLLNKSQKTDYAREDADFQLIAASDQIERVGRVASACTRTLVAGSPVLGCTVDLSRPSTNVNSYVRFLLVGSTLQYQRDDAGPGTFSGAITTMAKYFNVTGFQVCDDAVIAAAGGCTIEPAEYNNVRKNNVGAYAGRFFRFQLRGTVTPAPGTTFLSAFQGAFFIRNPTTNWAPLNVVYTY